MVEGFITGLHKSPFHGFSVEFAEHRLYNTGESTRHIDWKVYAKTDRIYTKRYEEETNLRCQIVIDCSGSMFFPKDAELTKFEYSVYSAASLIELLKRQRDAVGISLFSNKLEIHTPAKSSMTHHRYLYSELEKRMVEHSEVVQKNTNAIQALHDISELSHKRSLVILFSDLFDDPNRTEELFQALQHLRHNKHEVVIFHVIDQRLEAAFELENRPYNLIDMETGESVKLQPAEIREEYKKQVEGYFTDLKKRCTDYRIDFVPTDINQGYDQVLLEYLLKRKKLY